MKINKVSDYNEMSKVAAKIFASEVLKNPKGAFGFATGSTPLGMYKELINLVKADLLDMSGITAFNLDEYYPISGLNPKSYEYYMNKNLFDDVKIPKERRFIPNGEAFDPTMECEVYDELLSKQPIEMQILGMGTNGHIGFNEPSDVFIPLTHYVELAESTIESNKVHFSDSDVMPQDAITMGIGSILKAKSILLLVNSASKSKALKEALTGPVTPKLPASVLQLHPNVILVADSEALQWM